jgi:hypothetical protein
MKKARKISMTKNICEFRSENIYKSITRAQAGED